MERKGDGINKLLSDFFQDCKAPQAAITIFSDKQFLIEIFLILHFMYQSINLLMVII